MVKITAPITAQWSRANARAAANAKEGRRAVRVSECFYRCPSSKGEQVYEVTIKSIIRLQATCNCPAGEKGIICWHQSSALFQAVKRCDEVQKLMLRFARQ
jgi:hypothetical protein